VVASARANADDAQPADAARRPAPHPDADPTGCGDWALVDNVCCAQYCSTDDISENSNSCGGPVSATCTPVNSKGCISGQWPEVHAARPHDLVQADAPNARDVAVDAGVMMAEKADPRSNARGSGGRGDQAGPQPANELAKIGAVDGIPVVDEGAGVSVSAVATRSWAAQMPPGLGVTPAWTILRRSRARTTKT